MSSLWLAASLEAEAKGVNVAKIDALHDEREIVCLANIIHREARGELRGHRRSIGMVIVARRDDPSRQWPSSICEMAVNTGEFSGMMEPIAVNAAEMASWTENLTLAREVYDEAWKEQLLPRGWECVRFYKVSDARIARLTPKAQKQLRIGTKGVGFFKKLEAVETRGSHTFYRDPKRCSPMPTT
jgi:hypothetical protein